MPDHLSLFDALLLLLAAAGIGISKSGFAGVSLLHVLLFAFVFGAKDSTGVLLPMLVIGDVCAIAFFGKQAQWPQVRRLLPPTLLGVVAGTITMDRINEDLFGPLVGVIILALTVIQTLKMWKPKLFDKVPHTAWFAWTLGILAGMATMIANAAGPIVALYLLAVALPKLELVGTSAWFFLVVNVFKLPFSYSLGLINVETLTVDLIFAPGILLGMLVGRWMVHRIPQTLFNSLLLAFTAVIALRLVGFW